MRRLHTPWLALFALAFCSGDAIAQSRSPIEPRVQASAPAPAAPAAVIGSPAFAAYVDGVAREQMAALNIPGLAVALVDTKGNVLIRGYGVGADGNGKPVPVDGARSVLPIASISKTFAMVALMRLVDQGRVSLDAPVNQYLDFKLPTYPGARPITLRDLSRHEGGFEERWLATGAGETPDPRPWPEILAKTYPQLIAPPGTYASYSNYGAALIGYVVQRVSGKPYWMFLRDEVLQPLGMTSTSIQNPLPADIAARELVGWKVAGGVVRPDKRYFGIRTHPAGSLRVTLPDMTRYMAMLLHGGVLPDGRRFLSPTSMHILLEDVKRTQPQMPGIAAIFAEKDVQGVRFIGHGGDGDAHHTDLLLSPRLGFGIFYVALSAPGPQGRDFFTRAVVPKLVGERTFAPLPMPETAQAASFAAYAGAYRHYRWAFTSIEKILGLSSEFAVRDSGKGTLIVTGRLSPGEYVPLGQGLFRQRFTGEYLFMRPDAQGRMLLTMGGFPFVTAYKLDTVDTQAFTGTAFSIFVFSLSLCGAAAIGFAVVDARRRERLRAAGYALFGAALVACGLGLYEFFDLASAISESELEARIPSVAYPLLAIPVIAVAIVSLFVIGVARGPLRPHAAWRWIVVVAGTGLFAAFIAWIAHWHALGWQFP